MNATMPLRPLLCCVVLLTVGVPSISYAQSSGTFAVGGDAGAVWPSDPFENALTLQGTGEYYVTHEFGIRGLFGWTNPGVQNFTENHFRQVRLLLNASYYWDFGILHPYLTGGGGAYFVRLKLEGRPDPDGETRGGINWGGGAEVRVSPSTAVRGEARWDHVSHPPGLPNASAFNLTGGVKFYF
jgi:opacity protein-like surface antigen